MPRFPTRLCDRGSVTAELALALPVLVVLLIAGLAAVAAVTTKLGCVASARDAALAAARGAPPAEVEGLRLAYSEDTVTASARRSLKVGQVTCTATALREPERP